GRDDAGEAARRRLAERALRQILLAPAAGLLSGPHGLAAYLRTGLLGGPAAAISLPLDIGTATDTIPPHLRRAVTPRDRHSRFPASLPRPGPVPGGLPAAPHPAPVAGRPHQPDQSAAVVHVPPPDRRAPVGLGHHLAPRRHRDSDQPRPHPHPALPRTPLPRRLIRRLADIGRHRAVPGRSLWP